MGVFSLFMQGSKSIQGFFPTQYEILFEHKNVNFKNFQEKHDGEIVITKFHRTVFTSI